MPSITYFSCHWWQARPIITSKQSVPWEDRMPPLCFRMNFVLRHFKFKHLFSLMPGSTMTSSPYNVFRLPLHLLKLCCRSSWCHFQHRISQLYGRYLIDVRVSSVWPGILSVVFTVSWQGTKEMPSTQGKLTVHLMS